MIRVRWTLANGESGEVELGADDKWAFGREADPDAVASVTDDHQAISRSALVIRDSGPGPVVFRGQRDNGMRVEVRGADGTATPLEEGMAHHFTPHANTVTLAMTDEPLITVSVDFEERGSVVERRG